MNSGVHDSAANAGTFLNLRSAFSVGAVLSGLVALVLLVGCGAQLPEALVAAGKASLASGDYEAAMSSFEAASVSLAAGDATPKAKTLRFRARLGMVEAMTKMKNGEGAHKEFATLVADHADQAGWKVYRKVADDLFKSGSREVAVRVLDEATKVFPAQEAEILEVIASISANAGEDSPEMEALRSLGYVK